MRAKREEACIGRYEKTRRDPNTIRRVGHNGIPRCRGTHPCHSYDRQGRLQIGSRTHPGARLIRLFGTVLPKNRGAADTEGRTLGSLASRSHPIQFCSRRFQSINRETTRHASEAPHGSGRLITALYRDSDCYNAASHCETAWCSSPTTTRSRPSFLARYKAISAIWISSSDLSPCPGKAAMPAEIVTDPRLCPRK